MSVVSPGIHLLTFVLAAAEGILITFICDQNEDKCENIGKGKLFKLITLAFMPVVWIFSESRIRNWSRRYLGQRFGLEL